MALDQVTGHLIELSVNLTDEDKVSFARTLSDILDINSLLIPSMDDGERLERYIEGCT